MFKILSNEELLRKAPSIFTDGKSTRTSQKYQPISISNVI